MYRMTRIGFRPWKNWQIRWFVRRYGVDLDIAEERNPERYPNFNSFFVRALQPDARPLSSDPDSILSPVDGVVSQVGEIDGSRIFQAKGKALDLIRLLGGGAARAAPYLGGSFVTLYLAPKDYHRVHMPLGGRLRQMIHVPGRLFSVQPLTTRTVSGLFARNERVASLFETDAGPMAVVMVGAVFVASIETVWAGSITPRRGRSLQRWDYADAQPGVRLKCGEEMGRFNMGSTVVLLFANNRVRWVETLRAGVEVRIGQTIGSFEGGSPG